MEVVECAKKVAQSLARHNTLCFPHTTVSAAVAPAGEDGGGEKELPFLQNTTRSSSAAFVAQRCSRHGNCQLFRFGTLCWVFLAYTLLTKPLNPFPTLCYFFLFSPSLLPHLVSRDLYPPRPLPPSLRRPPLSLPLLYTLILRRIFRGKKQT